LAGVLKLSKEKAMNAHFIFGLALILVTLAVCYLFRKENNKR
jgi:hypothetical protein